MPKKVKVRVTQFADPIDVHRGEIPSLRAQGMLVEVLDDQPKVPASSGTDGHEAGGQDTGTGQADAAAAAGPTGKRRAQTAP